MNEHDEMRESVMEKIRTKGVHMRPRWHFIALSLFALAGIALVVLTLLYISSLAVFFMRDSGTWFVPVFGMRGWFALFHSIPWLLILLIVIFVVLLEILVQRYSFVYHKPLVVSIVGVVLFIAVAGALSGHAALHRSLFLGSRRGPIPLMMWYKVVRPTRPHDVYHGTVIAASSSGLIIADVDGEGTSTVLITPQTRLPYGADFSPGDLVVVFGNEIATNTVRAFGVREISE